MSYLLAFIHASCILWWSNGAACARLAWVKAVSSTASLAIVFTRNVVSVGDIKSTGCEAKAELGRCGVAEPLASRVGCKKGSVNIIISSIIGNLCFQDSFQFCSGGNGNFVLSTSICGYTSITGGCAPMIKDGYGFFYGIMPKSIEVWLLSHEGSKMTDAEGMWKNFESTSVKLLEMLNQGCEAAIQIRIMLILSGTGI